VILVAGGTGLLGGRLVRHLVDGGNAVRVLTRDPRRAAHLPVGVEIVTGDVRTTSVDAPVAGCTTVVSAIHGFAGATRTSPSAVDRDGNARLIAAACGSGVSRFVLVSVVGAAVDHPMSLHRMKHEAEQELRSSGLDAVVVRATSYLETWCDIIGAKVAGGGPALVLGPGENPINFVGADDVARFVAAAAIGDTRVGPLMCVGGPENLSFTQVAEQILASCGRGRDIRHVPLAVLRAMSMLGRAIHAETARKAQAAVVMNTTDMAFDARPTRDQFPDIPVTRLADLVAPAGSTSS
jgi:NADH dehydrogenase